jgi:choline dehydrogenase-like flavoprotein
MNQRHVNVPPTLGSVIQRQAFAAVCVIAFDLLRGWEVSSPHERENAATAFAWRQLRGMPDFLRGPVVLTLASLAWAMSIVALTRLAKSSADGRSGALRVVRRFGPYREVIRAVESLVLLGWKEDAHVPPRLRRRNVLPVTRSTCEFAVIGAGPGGCVSAAMLAEAGKDTLIFEEGDDLALASCEPFTVGEMQQKYRNGGMTTTFGSPKINYAEGRCVGGGSEVNSGLYHRTPASILERWQAEYGLVATEQELIPHFQANEQELRVSCMPTPPPPAASKLAQGAEALGWSCIEVPRWFEYSADGQGQRRTMTRSFLPRAESAGAQLSVDNMVRRLTREGSQWRIESIREGRALRTLRARSVILSAGAIRTAQLLQRSGLAQRAGRTLSMHPTVKVVALFPDEVNHPGAGVPAHQVKEFATAFSFGCSISSPALLALAMQDHPDHRRLADSEWRRMAVYYAMICPEGRGRIRGVPGFDAPLVTFSLPQRDLQTLSVAVGHLCRLLLAAGAQMLFPTIRGCSPLSCEADLARLPYPLPRAHTSLMTIHLFSSCPMGERRELCVTDSYGAVIGAPSLHVADASLLPSAPGVNPQGTVMAFARRNVVRLLEGRQD